MCMLERTFWLMHDNATASVPLAYVKSSQDTPKVGKHYTNNNMFMVKLTFLVDA